MTNKSISPTRSFGLLESFLAKKRAKTADSLILDECRKGKVLDIGCGVFPYFLVNSNFKERHGVDSFIHKFPEGSIRVKKVDIEKEKLPYKDLEFDVVVMLAVFEHVHKERLGFVLKEIKRVLKNKGVFIMTTPSPASKIILSLLSKIRLISKIEIEDHKQYLSSSQIKNLLTKNGFDSNKIRHGKFELGYNFWFKVGK